MNKRVIAIITCIVSIYSITMNCIAKELQPGFLTYPCAGCHGIDGISPGSIPSINGFSKQNFIKTMQSFRDGTRSSPVMNRIAKGYSDEELATIAGYFVIKKKMSGILTFRIFD